MWSESLLPAQAGHEGTHGGTEGVREQQLVRLDGTVLVSFLVAPYSRLQWRPGPYERIEGPCAGRVRVLPDGEWLVLAYFPVGWPGPTELWPDQEMPAEPFSIDTGAFLE